MSGIVFDMGARTDACGVTTGWVWVYARPSRRKAERIVRERYPGACLFRPARGASDGFYLFTTEQNGDN